MSLDDVGRSIRFGEAIDLIEGLKLEFGSHLATELAEFKWSTSMSEIAQLTLVNSYLSVHTDSKSGTPVGLPMPWKSEEEKASEVAPDERARLLAIIEARAAAAFARE